jgi:hypothetical protein
MMTLPDDLGIWVVVRAGVSLHHFGLPTLSRLYYMIPTFLYPRMTLFQTLMSYLFAGKF